jgi:hypothetical protein
VASAAAAWLVLGALVGCGYRAVYGGARTASLHVVLVRVAVADAVVADEVAAGVRDELAREGMLASGDGYPRVELEVVRVDRASEGIVGAAGVPAARATDVGVVARAWTVDSAGANPQDDTGDIRGEQVAAVDAPGPGGTVDLRATLFHDADAERSAARRAGRTIGRKILGVPAASDDLADPR